MSSKFRSSDRYLERTIPTWRSESPERSREARLEWEGLRARGVLPNRLLIDATYTLGSSRRSGIERVVHNLVDHGLALAGGSQVTAASLMSMHGQFYEMGPAQQTRLDRILNTQSDILGSLPRFYQRAAASLISAATSPKLKNWLLPEPGHMGMFKLPYRYWYRSSMRRICQQAKTILPGQGDLLVLPDAYWARKEIWPAVAAARQRGAYTAVVIYDLIPLTHPHFVGQRRTRRFEEYLKQVATHADIILAISSTVRRELEATLPELMAGQPYCQNICDFPLGAEFPARQGAAEPTLRDDLLDLFEGDRQANPYLTVAALDPRKNHRYLLDAFDLLWQRTSPDQRPKLCLVGRVGGHCGEIVQRIKHHPLLNRNLFAYHDLNDAELQYCYEKCRGVIFPSIVEGFGLPIVESMWHRAPTMASDTPIHREVGGDGCRYFDLDSPASLTNMLIAEQQSPSSLIRPAMAKPHSWQESAEIFYRRCLAGFRSGRTVALPSVPQSTSPLSKSA